MVYTNRMTYHFAVVITQDKDGLYVARVPSLRGCHTQAKTLPTLHKRLQEAMALCVEVEKMKKKKITQDTLVSVEQVELKL